MCLFAVLISQQVAFGLDLNGTDAESYPVVKTVNGPVKGVRRSFLNLTVDEFLGVIIDLSSQIFLMILS